MAAGSADACWSLMRPTERIGVGILSDEHLCWRRDWGTALRVLLPASARG